MPEQSLDRLHKPVKQEHALAQLNPHLIFNSLTAIQHFVMLDDKVKAMHYLSQLSKFIRLILQYSRHGFNTVESEKNLLAHYLELEQVRFDFKFSYQLLCRETERIIPSMILFPFVEEALYERVLASETSIEKRTLTIIFERNMLTTLISIIDNGTANRPNELKEAVKIAEARIDDLNNLHDDKIYLSRKFAPGNNCVSISIPHSIFK